MKSAESARRRSASQAFAEAQENALRSAARIQLARDISEKRRSALLAQRRLDRERRDEDSANRLWSVTRGRLTNRT
jgi:hypothetical protein